MNAKLAPFAMAVWLAILAPAYAINNDDIAALIGLLWRLKTAVCPSMSFDAEACEDHGAALGEPRRSAEEVSHGLR